MESKLYHLHALTGVHVGTGQGCGVIDLPIAREQASNLPLIPGSGIKGVLRYELEALLQHEDDYLALFGPETDKADDHAGALSVGDSRLLCLPIRSFRGTFAWATCPMVLHRYRRDLENNGVTDLSGVPQPQNEKLALHTEDSKLVEGKIYLEDLDLEASVHEGANAWAERIAEVVFAGDIEWKKMFKERFVILPDNVFDFLAETATEVRTRIKIKEDTRTVQNGNLWCEENLPAETIMWGCLATDKSRRNGCDLNASQMLGLLDRLANKRLQIGGNATVGVGHMRWLMDVGAGL